MQRVVNQTHRPLETVGESLVLTCPSRIASWGRVMRGELVRSGANTLPHKWRQKFAGLSGLVRVRKCLASPGAAMLVRLQNSYYISSEILEKVSEWNASAGPGSAQLGAAWRCKLNTCWVEIPNKVLVRPVFVERGWVMHSEPRFNTWLVKIQPKFMTEETKQIGIEETQQAELVRLPLWRDCAEKMLADGVDYGQTYPAEYFEERLRCKRDDMKFGLGVSHIRRALESKGFYLSGRGLKGSSFIILEPSDNKSVMTNYSAQALDALKRGVILGTNTRLDTLTAEERRRHESVLEKMAMRLVMMRKTMQVASAVKQNKPSLLEGEIK
jgi:hypothetical protein